MVCGILVPQPETEPLPPAMEAWSPNHWTAREFPEDGIFMMLVTWTRERAVGLKTNGWV